MRFHPKSRASTDQRLGPNIVRPPAMAADNRHTIGSSSTLRICEISIRATTAPATGVHSPANSSNPDPVTVAGPSVMCSGASVHRCGAARTMTTGPMTSRMSSKPMPGQLPANVEYRRRNAHLHRLLPWAARIEPPGRGAGVTL
jgi:hypothetical protein